MPGGGPCRVRSLCQCTTHSDCMGFEDGNLCNGTLVCLDFTCVVDPLTVVECNPTGDTACQKSQCAPETGQCAVVSSPRELPAMTLNGCTVEDTCSNGICQGQVFGCDDGNPCTYDACSAATGCVHTPHTQPCDDGDSCTGNDLCSDGSCAGQPEVCTDGNPLYG